MIKLISVLVVAVLAAALQTVPAAGQSLIRDAEIENTIRAYATPIFAAAGLDASSVRIHLLADPEINAFVAGGQQLFIYTGLLIAAKEPGEVIGVIAHECGHIVGGHLVRRRDAMRNARVEQILAMVLGAAAGVASGNGEAAGAVIAAGQGAAVSGMLKYTRTQEASADAAALKFLDRSGQSAKGLYDFLKLLERRQRMAGIHVDPFLTDHPLTPDRIENVAAHLALSRYTDVPPDPKLVEAQKMVRAKLIGFTWSFDDVMREYPDKDTSIPARYARAIAYYLKPDLNRALKLIDGLIANKPNDPYFYELKGQMLLETGRVADSVPAYQKAVDLAPDEPLLQTELAKAQVETHDPTLTEPAREHLEAAVRGESDLGEAWRLLTIVYNRQHKPGETALAQAQYSLLRGERSQAKALAQHASDILPHGSPGWLRAQDILAEADRQHSDDE